ncbi:hypothetical protein BJY01DRAFT_251552 [Aspergillus pseudoustus]|uniref:Uncharacterized protein n=1 Tax=Aspergillus pseudoustus TaxID=1810923 RepID=A0ABR4JBA1_9EURO
MEEPNAGTLVACPLETQRSMPGLILKLFVVHFVTLCFYSHCYHQREGRYLTPDALTFLIAPLNTLFRYAIALLGILGYLCCMLAYSLSIEDPQPYRRQVLAGSRNALSALLGQKKSAGIHRYSAILGSAPKPSWTERVAGRIGPVIPALAFITQCCGAIYLYHRRRQFDGVTLLDQQIFEQACGGLVIGLLSAGYTLKLPFFDEPVPDSRDSYLEHFVHFLRDQGDDDSVYTGDLQQWRLAIYFAKALAITFTVQLLLRTPGTDSIYDYILVVAVITSIPCLVIACFAPRSSSTPAAEVRSASLAQHVRRAITTFCVCWSAILLSCVTGALPLLGLMWQFVDLVLFGVQAAELRNVALDEPCPLLRMDPVAEYIWWLG